MRCIEMAEILAENRKQTWLIETWDVLKLVMPIFECPKIMINRNMRCIEIGINYFGQESVAWLIETWDVLKSQDAKHCRVTLPD